MHVVSPAVGAPAPPPFPPPDPGVLSVLEEVFHSLSCQPSCQESLLHHFTPTLVRILQSSEDHLPTGITSAVLDVWQQVLRGLPSPLPHVVIDPVFPLIVRNILQAEDSAILQVCVCVCVCSDVHVEYTSSLPPEWW